jgi:pimeloyl-ACP methyl ester carboxylesterase
MRATLGAAMAHDPALLPERLGLATAWFDLPSLRMHAAVAGPPDGPLVILLHGFPEFWYSWRHQIGPLAQAGYRVVAPDQRGYNLTDKTPPFDIATLAGDVLELVRACGRERCFIAGHDWGAAVAWVVAARHPERIERLAILNVPHPAVMTRALCGRNLRQIRRSWYIFLFQLPGLPEWWLSRRDFARLHWLMRASSRKGTFSDEDLQRYRDAWAQPGALAATIGWYRALGRSMLARGRRPEAGPVRVPTVILWGERDAALGVELAEESLAYLDRGKLLRYPKATHWLHEELPGEIASRLVAHFSAPPG